MSDTKPVEQRIEEIRNMAGKLRMEARATRSGARNLSYSDHSASGITLAGMLEDLLEQLSSVPSQIKDSARLEWLHAHDAGFGTSGHCVVDETGERWTSATFVRVPCKYLYEWHCYDGATWRDAIDTAMAAPACKGEDGDCESSHTIRDPGADHARRRREELRVASQIEAAVKAELAEIRGKISAIRVLPASDPPNMSDSYNSGFSAGLKFALGVIHAAAIHSRGETSK